MYNHFLLGSGTCMVGTCTFNHGMNKLVTLLLNDDFLQSGGQLYIQNLLNCNLILSTKYDGFECRADTGTNLRVNDNFSALTKKGFSQELIVISG